jgi:hypothetical protein
MDVALGWWAIPTIITVGALSWSLQGEFMKSGAYSLPAAILTVPTGIIVSLVAWVIYLAVS